MGRLRGYLWLLAGLVVAALAGSVAFIALSRATADQMRGGDLITPKRSVVVALRQVEVRGLLSTEDVELKELPVEAVPEGALDSIEQVIGRISLVALYPGEVVLQQRLLDPNVTSADGRMALVVAEDQVLMAFPASDLLSRSAILKPGDRVDFLFSFDLPVDRGTNFVPGMRATGTTEEGEEVETELVTFDLLQNVAIAALVGEQGEGGAAAPPNALLLVINPQDALVLKYMKDAGAMVDLVLRAPGAEGTFPVEPVDLDYLINGYIVPSEVVR